MKDETMGISILLAFLYIVLIVLVITSGCSEKFREFFGAKKVGFFSNTRYKNISDDSKKKIWELLRKP